MFGETKVLGNYSMNREKQRDISKSMHIVKLKAIVGNYID